MASIGEENYLMTWLTLASVSQLRLVTHMAVLISGKIPTTQMMAILQVLAFSLSSFSKNHKKPGK